MQDKIYTSMCGAGIVNIVLGVLTLIGGIVSGVILLINGGTLLHNKSKVFLD